MTDTHHHWTKLVWQMQVLCQPALKLHCHNWKASVTWLFVDLKHWWWQTIRRLSLGSRWSQALPRFLVSFCLFCQKPDMQNSRFAACSVNKLAAASFLVDIRHGRRRSCRVLTIFPAKRTYAIWFTAPPSWSYRHERFAFLQCAAFNCVASFQLNISSDTLVTDTFKQQDILLNMVI